MPDNVVPVPAPVQPLRVVVHDDSELVVKGLERMLAGQGERVVLLPPPPPGEPLPVCDVELYDPSYAPAGPAPAGAPGHLPGRKVAFSWDCSRDAVSTELARGALGYISKRVPAERLLHDLVQVAAGKVVVDVGAPRAARQPVRRSAAKSKSDWPLTDRETAVLALITQGLSNQEIAEELSLSINSIKSYIRIAYRKIDVSSRSQAVLWGVAHGLLTCHPTPANGSALPT